MTYTVSEQEHATILAALRHWQESFIHSSDAKTAFLDHFHDVSPLVGDDVEAICERINYSKTGPNSYEAWLKQQPNMSTGSEPFTHNAWISSREATLREVQSLGRAQRHDSYLSENASPGAHRYCVMIYHRTHIDYEIVEADTFADALIKIMPGNDAYKVEVVAC